MTELPRAESADGAYHVFMFHADKPRGGLGDLIASVTSLSDARRAVDRATEAGRKYHIVTVHPETLGLVIVETGICTGRQPLRINIDPRDPESTAWASPRVSKRTTR